MKNVIFLDIDGVLNCQLFYTQRATNKKVLRKAVKADTIGRMEYYKSNICTERVSWLNGLCERTDSAVVISSTWRMGKTVDELQLILNECGATFKIIDKTDHLGYERGVEIAKWLRNNTEKLFGKMYFDFYGYAIIDDDSDMLLNQAEHFFQTDSYSGLTPNTIYKIERFFTKKTINN